MGWWGREGEGKEGVDKPISVTEDTAEILDIVGKPTWQHTQLPPLHRATQIRTRLRRLGCLNSAEGKQMTARRGATGLKKSLYGRGSLITCLCPSGVFSSSTIIHFKGPIHTIQEALWCLIIVPLFCRCTH